ncbi:MAG: hypothetical protein EXR80_04250 [Methylococcales bacterium]|nr:hypothetical protein [Methylococcales bacterium]
MENTHNPKNVPCPKVSVNEHRLLVSPNKSKKLAEMANKLPVDLSVNTLPASELKAVSGLKSEFDIELQQACGLIDKRINEIINSFPQGKRANLFSLRFGSVAAIKSLAITAAFHKLAIHAPHINLRVLKSVNYHGDTV